MRICSFLPSATEIVYLLGLGDSLRGVSHECDFPGEARSKPIVVRSRVDMSDMSGAEIDAAVSDMMMRGENIYVVDDDALAAARPDLVITQQLCEVCAVSFEDVQAAVARLDKPAEVLSLDPHSVNDVISDILRVGRIAGAESAAHVAAFNMRSRIDGVKRALADISDKPRVACVEWLSPIIVAGHWVPEMVEAAGGADALAEPGAPSARIEFEQLVDANPDAVILMPCGMDAAQARAEFDALPDRARWESLDAFKNGRAWAVDSGALFSRSGPRLVDGVETLASILHPKTFGTPNSESAAPVG